MECQPTGNTRWTGDWQYEGCVPDNVRTHTGPDGVVIGIAMKAIYLWKRRYAREYLCCPGPNERRVWVDGNFAIYTFERYDAGYTTIGVDVGIPIPGILKDALDLLGIRIKTDPRFTHPNVVDAEKPADPDPGEGGNGLPVETPAPTAECGERITLPGGRSYYWWSSELGRPTEETPPPPREDVPDEIVFEEGARRCCDDYSGRALAPTFTVVRHDITRTDPTVSVDVRLEWTHACGVVGQPLIEVYFVYPGQGHFQVPRIPGVSRGLTQDGTKYHWEVSSQQIQVPSAYRGGGMLVRFRVRSKCGMSASGDYFLARTT